MSFKYNGREYSLPELIKLAKVKFGNDIPYITMYFRLNKRKWSVEKALKTPAGGKYEFNGKRYSLDELAKIAKKQFNNEVKPKTLSMRLSRDWTMEKALSIPVNERAEVGTEQRLKESRKNATKKYMKTHPHNARRIQNLSYSRTFIRKYANLDELRELEEKLSAMVTNYDENKDTGKFEFETSNNYVDNLSPEQQSKRMYTRSKIKAYLNNYATESGLTELLQLVKAKQQQIANN